MIKKQPPLVARSYVDVPNSHQQAVLKWHFSGVLASHRGGPGSIIGRSMSVLAVEDDLGQVSSQSFYKGKENGVSIIPTADRKAPQKFRFNSCEMYGSRI
jgi:hypothetical protein